MSLEILAIGTAVPDHAIAQREAATLALELANAPVGRTRALEAIYRRSGIRSRGSVLLDEPGDRPFAQAFFPPAESGGVAPSTGDRMARYAAEAGPLGIEASRRAIATAAVDPADVTHLVTCSCTGFASPGFDIGMVAALGLPSMVARTHVGFMGCHGAFNALRVAAAFAAAVPDALVLTTCVELCSLHFQYGAIEDHVVANSLFADGAAAVIASASGCRTATLPGWRILRQASEVVPGSTDEMGWLIGDSGFEMSLSARVPDLVAERLRPAVARVLAGCGLRQDEVATWAVHPGGPRILAGVERALDLSPEALAVSRGVLSDHGNMSSATILFILDRLARAGAVGPCVAMAFGPGLTIELAVLDRVSGAALPVRPK